MAAYVLDPEPIPGELFYLAPHSEVKQVLDTATELLRRTPAILARIDEDRDARALVKKLQRRADAQWGASHTACFPEVTWPEARELEARELSLGQGCPRMPAEVVFVFFVLEGYLGSVTDRRARDLLLESQTLNLYLQSRGLKFPGWTTIRDNLNAISVDTRDFILDAQLAMIHQEELDDFLTAVVDSTAVQANSAWPTDGRTLLGLLGRAFHVSQKLEDFGLPNIRKHWVPRWLRDLKRLLFQINMASGKPHATRKRRKYYRRLLEKAEHILDHLLPECFQRDPTTEVTGVPPSRRGLLARLWSGLKDYLIDACAVYDYTYERIFEGQQRPAKDKLLSLGDPSAAYIEKGSREPVIGYKPQVARSGNGFVTALLVTEGNPADSTQLAAMAEQIEERTGVQPGTIGGMFRLNPFVADIPETYAVTVGGVRVLVAGAVKKGGSGCYCPENSMLRALVSHLLLEKDTALVLDMEAGVEHLGRGVVQSVDHLLVVVNPGQRSIDTARRVQELAADIGLTQLKKRE